MASAVASHSCTFLSLLSKEQSAQECDATADAMKTKVRPIKNKNAYTDFI